MMRAAPILLAAGLAAGRLIAQPAFYSKAYLEKWKPEYQTPLEADYREVVLPRLTPAERRKLNTIQIDFPLFGQAPQQTAFQQSMGAFEFYSLPSANPPRIVMPVSSLRFFGDVCVATAWWEQQATSGLSPVLGYISQTKYGRAPRRALRDAVGVPANATDSPKIADFADKCVSSGFLFILLHEMGHIVVHERRLASQDEETAADGFALEIFRRLGTPPTGSVLFFSAYTYAAPNRWDFSTEQEYAKFLRENTHPLTSQRLRALGKELTDHAADYKDPNPRRGPELARQQGGEIRRLADFMDDYGVQRAIKLGSR